MQYTLSLFEHFYKNLPPLIPNEIKEQMASTLGSWQNNFEVKIEEIEMAMIKFGYEVWPYNQAFNDFYNANFFKQGEHFLNAYLDEKLQQKFLNFKVYGGGLEDLVTGNPAVFFTDEERADLCVALVEMKNKLRDFTKQEVLTLRKKEYLESVAEYSKSLKKLKKEIGHLYDLSLAEKDHPLLSAEIKEKAKSLEYSLCSLEPDFVSANVCDLPDFFAEHKLHLDNLKGIHLTAEIDFYKE